MYDVYVVLDQACVKVSVKCGVGMCQELVEMKEAIYQLGKYSIPLKILDAAGQQAVLQVSVIPE